MKKKVIVIVLGSLVGLGALWGVNRQFGLVGLMQEVNIVKGVFPWEDVVPCINEKAEVLESRCFWCGRHKKLIYFRSPDRTWKNLCGVSGDLVICEHCKMQYGFDLISMN